MTLFYTNLLTSPAIRSNSRNGSKANYSPNSRPETGNNYIIVVKCKHGRHGKKKFRINEAFQPQELPRTDKEETDKPPPGWGNFGQNLVEVNRGQRPGTYETKVVDRFSGQETVNVTAEHDPNDPYYQLTKSQQDEVNHYLRVVGDPQNYPKEWRGLPPPEVQRMLAAERWNRSKAILDKTRTATDQ